MSITHNKTTYRKAELSSIQYFKERFVNESRCKGTVLFKLVRRNHFTKMLKLILGYDFPNFYKQMSLLKPHSKEISVWCIFVFLLQKGIVLAVVVILVHTLFAQNANDTHHAVLIKHPTLLCLTTRRQELHKFFC